MGSDGSAQTNVLYASIPYIDRQAQHHRTQTFQEEYRNLLQQYRVEFDERHFWD
jgi:putative transposase